MKELRKLQRELLDAKQKLGQQTNLEQSLKRAQEELGKAELVGWKVFGADSRSFYKHIIRYDGIEHGIYYVIYTVTRDIDYRYLMWM